MNVNTIVFGGRYRVSASANGKIKTIHDPVTGRTIASKFEVPFDARVTEEIESLFRVAAQEEADNA
jgi:hypothetical protein